MKKPMPSRKPMPKHKPAMPMPKHGKGAAKKGKPDRDYEDQ